MIKTYVFGLLLGVAATIATAWFVPFVDQHRESSIISVTPNGGNTEVFYINIPFDRVLYGAPGDGRQVPDDLRWPEDPVLGGVRAEMFKIRNERDTVVGVASRVAGESDAAGATIEWVLHLPARGSVFIAMRPEAGEGGYRLGRIRAGTREFDALQGSLTERWVDMGGDVDRGSPSGRIELVSRFVGRFEDAEPVADLAVTE